MDNEDKIEQLEARVAAIEKHVIDASRNAAEAVWAQVFHDTIRDSSWLKNKTFSPGRWAVGYAYLYVMYRILNEMRPKCILDLGLGQTTRMIAQYAAANPDVEHIVVENSKEWIDFWKRGCCADGLVIPDNTRIVRLDYGFETVNGKSGVRVYKRFKQALRGKVFDFVSIDAPLSGDMKEIGRVDVLKLVPQGIAKRFAIIFDDTQRLADRMGFDLLVEKLKLNGRASRSGRISGAKDSHLVVSEDLAYLKSL